VKGDVHGLVDGSDGGRSVLDVDEVALVLIGIPSTVNKVTTFVSEHLVDQLLDIIPAVGNTEGEKLTVFESGVGDGDLVGGDRSSVHCENTIPQDLKKVNRKVKKITSFTISPTLLDGWRYVPYELTTNRTWTPGITGVLSIYTNKLGVYVLSCYLTNIQRI
jgi:hypothetical protein